MRNILLQDFIPVNIQDMRPVGFHNEKFLSMQNCCQKVEQGSGWQSVDRCPLCGSPQRSTLMQKCSIDIVQCHQCKLGYATKIPKEIHDVYADEKYLNQAQRDYGQNISYRIKRFAKERVEILRKWSGRAPEECSLLDIGCGTGWFLDFCRQQGYTIAGQEFGKELAAHTEKRLETKIWSCPVSEIEKNAFFDIITLFDVLEHTADPFAMLSEVKSLLQPGGISLIFVPNLHSLGASILQEESALVAPAEHLLYFTRESLEYLVEKVGFELLHIETRGMDIPDLIAYYRDRSQQPEVTAFLLEYADIFQAVIDKAGRANHMRIVLRKPQAVS
ncbi:MAG: methyltransferase domain-containing protein [Candidatus Electrothrix sp. AW2]|nr:methyltransferase domain-containing protein [Candidatus Electrothrix gigas]